MKETKYNPVIVQLAPKLYTLSGRLPQFAQGRYYTNVAAALKAIAEIKGV